LRRRSSRATRAAVRTAVRSRSCATKRPWSQSANGKLAKGVAPSSNGGVREMPEFAIRSVAGKACQAYCRVDPIGRQHVVRRLRVVTRLRSYSAQSGAAQPFRIPNWISCGASATRR
jgi:hypothetical protein